MVKSFPLGLSITAVAARDLAKKKRFGAQDPYLAFYIQGRRKFTIVAVKGGVNPEWNQTIRYNQIRDTVSKDGSTLTVTCYHEKTGVKVGSGDGLIGTCQIDLKQSLFKSETGRCDQWFQLMNDGKDSGQVHLRLQLCEPIAEEDTAEYAPIRNDKGSASSRDKKDRKREKGKVSIASPSAYSAPSQANGVQRAPTIGRLHRTKSMADLTERKPTVKFQEPVQRRVVSRSLEEVRDTAGTPTANSSDAGSRLDTEDERSISSPKQTFTLQDSDGNINPLNVLIAPFDPSWLEPTPPILRRALSAQFYYEDLQTQMQFPSHEIFPRPHSQQGYNGFPAMPQGPVRNYQNFSHVHQQHPNYTSHQQQPLAQPQLPTTMPIPQPHTSQQPLQQQHHSTHPLGSSMSQTLPTPGKTQLPTPQNQPFTAPPTISVAYHPHTVFQPRQPGRGKVIDMTNQPKHMSLPARYQMPASETQHLQNVGGSSGPEPQTSSCPPLLPHISSLGPAIGFLPETYSPENQRALSYQLPSLVTSPDTRTVPSQATLPVAGGFNGKSAFKMSGSLPEIVRPDTRNASQSSMPLINQAASGSRRAQDVYNTSPTPENQIYRNDTAFNKSIDSSNAFRQTTSSLANMENFNTMHKSPAIPVPAKLPAKAKDAIFGQFTPRAVPWDGKDISDSVADMNLGRRIVSRYALGMHREKYIREGFYIREKSPLFADSQTFQQKRPSIQQRSIALQRKFTMDNDSNDRVILKYLKSRRDWEIDCVMMRYLTCSHPEVKLESQYMDYPQPQQHSNAVSPFVVGLYETFVHNQGSDADGCRYLSILQWFPESLQLYISDRFVSREGVDVLSPIIRNLIECVEFIHSRKVCHLNIKPSNFVRDPYASSCLSRNSVGWKLVDFDAARIIGEEMVGRCTFSYAAPEILKFNAKSKGCVARAALDIWSLGLVIYELLTDRPLFPTDDHAKDVLLDNSMKPVRYYDKKNIQPEYWPLLDAMLVYDPEKRLSASQLLQLDLFKNPFTFRPVTQDRMVRNNNIQTLRDLKATRLCNLKGVEQMEQDLAEQRNKNSHGHKTSRDMSTDFLYSLASQQMLLLEGIGRVLDSPFDQVPRLFMLFPPMLQDLETTQPFLPSNLFQNQKLRLVLLCEGLSGYGEDAHVTDHRGYVLHDPSGFVQEVGKILLHLVSVAGTNNPGYKTPALDNPLTMTGTPLDNCQRWYPSLTSYYDILQSSIQRLVGPSPSLSELRSLRGPTLKSLETWLAKLVRQETHRFSESTESSLSKSNSTPKTKMKVVSAVGQSDLISHAGFPLGGRYDDLADELSNLNMTTEVPEVREVTGPGGGEGYGGLYKMPVGTCGDRWICRGCVSKQLAMATDVSAGTSSYH
ncbi:hypothetical protein BG004_001010 [Podila humilis]|nr:hypothetical protein BG004_001010 [Podila humilis]